jgi:hypothetical protein
MAAVAAAVGLGATWVLAASPQVEAAMKTLRAVGSDPGKLKIYCDIQKATEALGEKEDQKAEEQIDAMTKQLGPDFEKAFASVENLDENSADAKDFYKVVDELDDKCTKR